MENECKQKAYEYKMKRKKESLKIIMNEMILHMVTII